MLLLLLLLLKVQKKIATTNLQHGVCNTVHFNSWGSFSARVTGKNLWVVSKAGLEWNVQSVFWHLDWSQLCRFTLLFVCSQKVVFLPLCLPSYDPLWLTGCKHKVSFYLTIVLYANVNWYKALFFHIYILVCVNRIDLEQIVCRNY